MLRHLFAYSFIMLSIATAFGGNRTIVADAVTHAPLSNASVFDCRGRSIGICNRDGSLPRISAADYPVTVRYLGYKERAVNSDAVDTIFLDENITVLPEYVVESTQNKMLHILAYVREYSTLSTYTDTVQLFREKMVDFMLPTKEKPKFKGWRTPRVLKSKSYYRFTNIQGLDSVSDRCNNHFSWSDWLGVLPSAEMPKKLRAMCTGQDTLYGKYSPTETWQRNGDMVTLDINVLADTSSRRWVPNLSEFFRENVDFEQFRLRYNYDNVTGGTLSPSNITGYSMNIESNGRGRQMFRFNRRDQQFYVNSYAEVYMLDKEYITVSEARKWENKQGQFDNMEIYEPAEAPELQPDIRQLVERVANMDHIKVRMALAPDQNLKGRGVVKQNFGQRVLQMFKDVTGISSSRANKKWNKEWKDVKKSIRDKSK